MTASEYCDFCDLPKAQCIHGQPPPAPQSAATAAPKPRKRPATRRTPGAAAAPMARRWTPPESFKPLIVEVLQHAGGELDAEEMFLELEIRVEGQLREGDREKTPQGELRWQAAARRARMMLIDEGVMTKDRPGSWQLSS